MMEMQAVVEGSSKRVAETKAVGQALCACGRTEFAGTGQPLLVIACYCDDCQAASQQINARPGGHGGARADGGTVSTLYRKDRVRALRGAELLVDLKLRPSSPTTRVIASCCNSNMLTRFDNWLPFVALRSYSNADAIQPQLCIHTKFAPDRGKIAHGVPLHGGIPFGMVMKIMGTAASLRLERFTSSGQMT